MTTRSHELSRTNLWSYLLASTLLFFAALAIYAAVSAPPIPGYGTIPESGERALYIGLTLLLIPIGAATAWLLSRIHVSRTPGDRTLSIAIYGLAALRFATLISLILDLRASSTGSSILKPAFVPVLVAAEVFAVRSFLLKFDRKNDPRHGTALFIALSTLYVFCTLSFRLYAADSITDSFQMTVHLDAALYSVAQVVAGKSVLVNLPAQYGLYAEILHPIFKVIGFSVLKFTAVMAVLEIAALMAVLWVLFQVIKLNVLRALAGCALIAVMGYTWMAPSDAYFQYYPIRFFFPAVSIALYWRILTRPSRAKIATLAIITSLAVPFNLDSGIPALGSCFAALFFDALSAQDRAGKLRDLGLFCAVAVVTGLAFVGILQAATGSPDWLELVKYQKIFYISGMYMLPIAHDLSYWMLIVGIYVFGIVGYLGLSMWQSPTRVWKLVFQVSVLGVGLFSYYQGRSHIIVLMLASWPALLVLFILTDRTLRASNANLLPPVWRSMALPAVMLAVFLSTMLAFKMPAMATSLIADVSGAVTERATPVTRTIAFLRAQITHPASTVIIAPHQAVYYAETGIASAVDGPGIAENVLWQDRVAFVKKVLAGPVKDVFYQPNTKYLEPEYLPIIKGAFKIVATSPDGMIHLQRTSARPTSDHK